MYLKNALILQSGAIEDLEIAFGFSDEGNPKPTVIVGRNGTGKSNLLSFITDALIEIAAKKFADVALPSPSGRGHQWHRISGGVTVRIGSQFDLALLKFVEDGEDHTYVSKAGKLPKENMANRLQEKFPQADWPEEGNHKLVHGQNTSIERIFRDGCYVSFPSDRSEKAYWSVEKITESDSSVFSNRIGNILGKPISLKSTLQDFRPWLVDVFLDSTIDPVSFMSELQNRAELQNRDQQNGQSSGVPQTLIDGLQKHHALENVNTLLREVLGASTAILGRTSRHAGPRKIVVMDGQNNIILPGLDAFSAGQAMLMGIFGTILRYADERYNDPNPNPKATEEMQGIVLVDEIDAHLHADLLHDVLPRLMTLFPKIQFIVTAHDPLFPLGMEKAFGTNGYSLLEMPDGRPITAEQFSEFVSSFTHMENTESFNKRVMEKVANATQPRVICEGETDPKYLKKAAGLLKFEDIANGVEFDWIGTNVNGQATGGGAGQLQRMNEVLQKKPELLNSHTILLFDCDQKGKVSEDDKEFFHAWVLDKNTANKKCPKGIENLLPTSVFKDHFYDTEEKQDGPNTITKKILNKVKLCDYLCEQKSEAADFEGFRPALEKIRDCLSKTA